MRPTRIRTAIALGLSAGAVLWTAAASPATAASPAGTDWREAGHYDTTAACQRTGRSGVERHKWAEYKCRPGRNDNYVTLWVRGSGAARALTSGPAAG
ncbi:hypothetical protein VT50_0230815 [Streptomyces antioxidans]|uniref:Secreted protein n=1 Tax=Streptomyces antioxidans TaxID=1507734 RepID=A0A1V4CX28_9ACTN|nr:hypothetical protein [Streptomyces antioxidans]OPF72671.1 hypothetical protein VT50_0230815 [Streptomyces antioxidans]